MSLVYLIAIKTHLFGDSYTIFFRNLQDFVFKSIVFIHFITFIFNLVYSLGINWGYWDIFGFRFYH